MTDWSATRITVETSGDRFQCLTQETEKSCSTIPDTVVMTMTMLSEINNSMMMRFLVEQQKQVPARDYFSFTGK